MTDPYYTGEHITLYLGDARDIPEWRDTDVDVLVTDPPYGMTYRSNSRTATPKHDFITGDHNTDLRDQTLQLWGDRPALVFGQWAQPKPASTRLTLYMIKEKNGSGMGDLTLPWGCVTEEVYVLGSGFVGRRQSNVIRDGGIRHGTSGLASQTSHPTPKNPAVMEHLLTACPPHWTIADPFAGSGATLIAARNMGRRAIGVEIEEQYCELIAARLQQEPLPL
jgi:site-specific DNA-methyltransferase (adenine-specific)